MGLSLKELNITLENMKSNPQSAGIPLASDTNAGLLSPDEKKYIDGLVNGQYTFNDLPDPGLKSRTDIIGMINESYTNAKSVNSSLSNISNQIGNIGTGGSGGTTLTADATPDTVLKTATFQSASYPTATSGNIPVASTLSYNAGSVYGHGDKFILARPSKGYYDGTAVVQLNDDNFIKSNIVAGATIFGLAGEYVGTTTTTLPVLNNQADENCILSGKSAYSSTGATTSVVGGNIPVISDSTSLAIDAATISTPLSLFGDTVGLDIIPPRGYYDGVVHLDIKDLNFKAENIKKDVTIFGVKGTYTGSAIGSEIPASKLKVLVADFPTLGTPLGTYSSDAYTFLMDRDNNCLYTCGYQRIEKYDFTMQTCKSLSLQVAAARTYKFTLVGNYLYFGDNQASIYKVNATDLTIVAQTSVYGADQAYTIADSAGNLYTPYYGPGGACLTKYSVSGNVMTLVWKNESYVLDTYGQSIEIDEVDRIYGLNADNKKIYLFDTNGTLKNTLDISSYLSDLNNYAKFCSDGVNNYFYICIGTRIIKYSSDLTSLIWNVDLIMDGYDIKNMKLDTASRKYLLVTNGYKLYRINCSDGSIASSYVNTAGGTVQQFDFNKNGHLVVSQSESEIMVYPEANVISYTVLP